MNKLEMRNMLATEVRNSNLSVLAKGLLCELLEAESGKGWADEGTKEPTPRFIRTKHQAPTPVAPEPGTASESPVRRRYRTGKVKEALEARFEIALQDTFQRLRAHARGYQITIPSLTKRFDFPDDARVMMSNYIRSRIKTDPNYAAVSYRCDKKGLPGYLVWDDGQPVSSPAPQKEQATDEHPADKLIRSDFKRRRNKKTYPMTKLEFMYKFRSDAVKRHMAEGHDYLKACRMALQDYSAYMQKAGDNWRSAHDSQGRPDLTGATFVEFPEIRYITGDTEPYLKDILRKLDNGTIKQVTEAMDAYVLNIPDAVWSEFLADLLVHEQQIKAALNLTKGKDFVVRYRSLFFE